MAAASELSFPWQMNFESDPYAVGHVAVRAARESETASENSKTRASGYLELEFLEHLQQTLGADSSQCGGSGPGSSGSDSDANDTGGHHGAEMLSSGSSSNPTTWSGNSAQDSGEVVVVVEKRNARERRRVQTVNQAFASLRHSIPLQNRKKRVSKVKTLRKAIEYISHLRSLINQQDNIGNQTESLSNHQDNWISISSHHRRRASTHSPYPLPHPHHYPMEQQPNSHQHVTSITGCDTSPQWCQDKRNSLHSCATVALRMEGVSPRSWTPSLAQQRVNDSVVSQISCHGVQSGANSCRYGGHPDLNATECQSPAYYDPPHCVYTAVTTIASRPEAGIYPQRDREAISALRLTQQLTIDTY